MVIDDARDPTLRHDLTNQSVLLDGDTAVLLETDRISGTRDGKVYAYDARLTVVYVRRAGRWRALTLHFVRGK